MKIIIRNEALQNLYTFILNNNGKKKYKRRYIFRYPVEIYYEKKSSFVNKKLFCVLSQ